MAMTTGASAAEIQVRFVTNGGATALVGTTSVVSDANAARIIAAQKIHLGQTTNQATIDAILRRLLTELIRDTKEVERNAVAIVDIPVTP